MEIIQQYHGFFLEQAAQWSLMSFILIIALGFYDAPLFLWGVVIAGILHGFGVPEAVTLTFVAGVVLFMIPPIRRAVVSNIVMNVMKKLGVVPNISETERVALEAGVVWVEADLFSGKPDFKKLMKEPYPELTDEEKRFMSGPVEKLCELVDDWNYWKTRKLTDEAWNYMRREKFFGMIIPKEYGGLGFSALCHSEVIQKLASRSVPASVTVMVPNSLGPAELLIHYGTDEQKKHYLPRLATGEDIPCFALTEPNAGSDAGAIQAEGILFKGTDGKLYVRLTWNKRWITLAAISTVLGLAFRLRDPENLLGKGTDVGITCALIPTKTAGVVVGKRHDPLGVPFYNCPTQGKDVVVSIDHIVGGLGGAGQGWKMLMECLAAGRGVSLPAQSTGGMKVGTRVVSAHATVRKQFGISIGKFEGIEEPLARIAGFTYLMEAFRKYTLGALDQGIKPPVVTAIAKYHATELGRKCINDAMDIVGGAAISRGPRNILAHQYIASPIGITVEGANILTRTLIIFGQGALRAHPFAFKEVNALEKGDLKAFDQAFWGHVGHVVRNMCRSFALSVSRAYLTSSPVSGPTARYFRKLTWISASFAIMADIAMASLGGSLKMREKLTGRFADILSYMYIGTAILRRFHAEGSRKEDLPFVHFTMNHVLFEIQKAFDGIFANFTIPGLSWVFRGPLRWWSSLNSLVAAPYADQHTHKIASLIMEDSEQRDRITEGIYMPKNPDEALARLDRAFKMVKSAEKIDFKIRKAVKDGRIEKIKGPKQIEYALKAQIITAQEFETLQLSEKLRNDAIQVDDFSEQDYVSTAPTQKSASSPHLSA